MESVSSGGGGERDEESISMLEVLEEEQQREEDANAVLGASDDKHCTYPQGTLPRQALYACSTCISDNTVSAGVCLACSLECHDGHELYELYTKRNFCCDCGNSKFGERKCKLWPTKKTLNSDNYYNQNFQGVYCTCHRPYPDPEDEVEDEMIQCVICEDWLHGRHLKAKVPVLNTFEEMTCHLCIQKHQFLLQYTEFHVSDGKSVTVKKSTDESASVNVDETNVISPDQSDESTGQVSTSSADAGPTNSDSVQSAPDLSVEENTDKPKTAENKCQLKGLREVSCPEGGVSLFWGKNWRKRLCACEDCVAMYKEHAIPFITDENDTITAYEEKGRRAQGSQYDKGMEALSQMNRVQQVEMISGYNDLKTELTSYLKKFADSGKVVSEENIREFFTTMASRKKQKVDIPYFCK